MFKTTLRVYYEDTDMAGVVYYANYLKFLERGRSDAVREAGISQRAMRDDQGLVFVVRRVEADYLRPAHFDDVRTCAAHASPCPSGCCGETLSCCRPVLTVR